MIKPSALIALGLVLVFQALTHSSSPSSRSPSSARRRSTQSRGAAPVVTCGPPGRDVLSREPMATRSQKTASTPASREYGSGGGIRTRVSSAATRSSKPRAALLAGLPENMRLSKHTLAVDPLPLDFSGGKPFYVYLYRDPRPGKKRVPIYVGKGTVARKRADTHWRQLHWKRTARTNLFFAAVLQKILDDGLEPIVETVGWFDTEIDAFAIERKLIARLGRRNLGRGPLCNLTDGGEGGAGLIVSPETRAKLSGALLGRTFSPEHRANLSASSLGKPLNDKQLAARAASSVLAAVTKRGSKDTAETRSKEVSCDER